MAGASVCAARSPEGCKNSIDLHGGAISAAIDKSRHFDAIVAIMYPDGFARRLPNFG